MSPPLEKTWLIAGASPKLRLIGMDGMGMPKIESPAPSSVLSTFSISVWFDVPAYIVGVSPEIWEHDMADIYGA